MAVEPLGSDALIVHHPLWPGHPCSGRFINRYTASILRTVVLEHPSRSAMACCVHPSRRQRLARCSRLSVAHSSISRGNSSSASSRAARQVVDISVTGQCRAIRAGQRRTRAAVLLKSYRFTSGSATHADECVHISPLRTSNHRHSIPGSCGPHRTIPCRSPSSAVGSRWLIQPIMALTPAQQ
jgi:hypothetical protein